MARTREPEIEFDPRHRIVGAIVLVTLAVILLPLILDEHPNHTFAQTDTSSSGVSPKPGPLISDNSSKPENVVVKKLNINQLASSEQLPDTTRAEDRPGEKIQTAKSQVVTKKIEPVSTTKTVSEKPVPTKAESSSVAKSGTHTANVATQPHWAVQVGTFSNQSNVRRLKKQLEKSGFSVMFKDIKLKQGDAVRVRVGPYSSRASANKAQGKIKQDIGIKGVVVAGP